MSDDRWRNTYDAWKTSSHADDAWLCEKCEAELIYVRRQGWYCEECNPRDPDAEREEQRELREDWRDLGKGTP